MVELEAQGLSFSVEKRRDEIEGLAREAQLEFRRGTIILSVLAGLRKGSFGYPLRDSLAEHGIAIDEGTYYPLLHRLEKKGFLAGEWRKDEGQQRRFFSLTPKGKNYLNLLIKEWRQTNNLLEALL